MKKSELSKWVESFDKKELENLVVDLHNKYDLVREYIDFQVDPKEEKLFKAYKKKIDAALNLRNNGKFDLTSAKNALRNFGNLNPSRPALVELMVHFLESCTELLCEHGPFKPSFYKSMQKVYAKAITIMYNNGLIKRFGHRTFDVFLILDYRGWELHDDLFFTYFVEYDLDDAEEETRLTRFLPDYGIYDKRS